MQAKLKKAISYGIVDLIALVGVFYIPVISHVLPFPLYLIEPMRIVLFSIILLTGNYKQNAIIMALAIPMFSSFASGHPLFPKNILMSMELAINVGVLYCLLKNKINMAISIFLSIILSKALYYMVKYALLSFALMEGELIATNFVTQILVALLLSCIFGILGNNLMSSGGMFTSFLSSKNNH